MANSKRRLANDCSHKKYTMIPFTRWHYNNNISVGTECDWLSAREPVIMKPEPLV